jgi:hypothetical protein
MGPQNHPCGFRALKITTSPDTSSLPNGQPIPTFAFQLSL